MAHDDVDGAIVSAGGRPAAAAPAQPGSDGREVDGERHDGGGSRPPPHHRAQGGFRNPWPTDEPHGLGDFLRWVVLERLTAPRRPSLDRREFAAAFRLAVPAFATPRAEPHGRLLATWVGHSTFLVQVGGLNFLTDPVWSERASPVPFAGPKRWTAPGVVFDDLPPIDVVLISHDHYDHLDELTVRRLVRAHPAACWLAPLGVAAWLARRGVRRVAECDWWDDARLTHDGEDGVPEAVVVRRGGPPAGKLSDPESHPTPNTRADARTGAAGGTGGDAAVAPRARFTCVPAQHFSGRRANNRNATLWCGWTIQAGGRSVYYVGDTGYFPGVSDAARRGGGPFDLVLMPVGAYEPRWFMRPVHNAPEDAVRAYQELAAAAPPRAAAAPTVMAGMHWGTFKLTDEPMEEPPRRTREAWANAGLPPESLWLPAFGETREI